MCGRYTETKAEAVLAGRFGFPPSGLDLSPRWNVRPLSEAPVVRVSPEGGRVLGLLRWGLVPAWADEAIGAKLINARSETAAEKPSFRSALATRRCLVLADGFYEWKKAPAGGRKQPHFFQRRDGAPFAFAGLWEARKREGAGPLRTFTILTTPANGVVGAVHERMPVILDERDEALWLDPKATDPALVLPLLVPAPDEILESWPVSLRVNAPGADGPELTQPA